MTIAALFDTYALGSAEQQEHAQEVVGGRPFSADLSRGVVAFEPGLEVRAELIGSEATEPGSWMWSWANPSGFPAAVTGAARHARGYGEANGVDELTTGEIRLDGSALGYRLAVITCGLVGGYAYYPATAAPGTTAYLLLDHPSLALPPVQLSRVLTVLTALTASGQVSDWRRALHTYAGSAGWSRGRTTAASSWCTRAARARSGWISTRRAGSPTSPGAYGRRTSRRRGVGCSGAGKAEISGRSGAGRDARRQEGRPGVRRREG